MTTFQGSGFVIELPSGAVDASTYVFLLPPQGNFRPSIVVQFENTPPQADLLDYVARQRAAIRDKAKYFDLVSEMPTTCGKYAAVWTSFEWDPPSSVRLRQTQLYVAVPEHGRVYSATATCTARDYPTMQPTLDVVLRSFLANDVGVL